MTARLEITVPAGWALNTNNFATGVLLAKRTRRLSRHVSRQTRFDGTLVSNREILRLTSMSF